MSWDEATKIWAEQTGPDDGFYLSLQVRFFVSWITFRVVFPGLTKYTISSEKLTVHINYCSVLQNAFSLALKLILFASNTEYQVLLSSYSGDFLIGM